MKKLWLVFPALLLMAGMVLMGCGSEGGGSKDIEWVLSQDGTGDDNDVGTKTTTKITVTFTSAVDALTRPADVAVTGAASLSAAPSKVGDGKTWELPVDVTSSGEATVTLSKAGVKAGSAKIQVWLLGGAPPSEYTFKASLPFGAEYAEGQSKIWDFEAEVPGIIESAEEDKTGHKVRMYFTAPAGKETYGIGEYGVVDGDLFPITAPATYNSGTTQAEVDYDFYVDGWVSWALAALDNATDDPAVLSVALYTDHSCVLVDAELWEPETDVTPPQVPGKPEPSEQQPMAGYLFVQEIAIEGTGIGEISVGKGWIQGDDYDAIVGAEERSRLRFYFRLLPPYDHRNGWGLAKVGTQDDGPVLYGKAADDNHEFFVDVTVKSILDTTGVTTAGKIFVNSYGNGAVITLCELWEPDPEYVKPDGFTLVLDDNSPYGYQALLKEVDDDPLFAEEILAGDEYDLTVTFTSDVAITTQLQCVLINDNPWRSVSGYILIANSLAADTEHATTVKIVATGASNTAATAALAITVNQDQTAKPTLTFTEFTFTRSKRGEAVDPTVPVESIPKAGFTVAKEITIDTSISGGDPDTGKGNITGDDLAAIVAANPWSVLRFYLKDGGNYGIGQIGTVQLLGGYTGKYHDIRVQDLGDLSEATEIFCNIWTGSIVKVELLSPPAGTVYTNTETLTIVAADDPPGNGKGNIEGSDFTTFNDAAVGSFLRFTFTGLDGSSGGIGNITNAIEFIDNSNGYMDIDVADIKATVGSSETWVFVNFWNGVLDASVELWEPSIDG